MKVIVVGCCNKSMRGWYCTKIAMRRSGGSEVGREAEWDKTLLRFSAMF